MFSFVLRTLSAAQQTNKQKLLCPQTFFIYLSFLVLHKRETKTDNFIKQSLRVWLFRFLFAVTDIHNTGRGSCFNGGGVLGLRGRRSRYMERSMWLLRWILSPIGHVHCHHLCFRALLRSALSHLLLQTLQQIRRTTSSRPQHHQGNRDRCHLPRLISPPCSFSPVC